MNYNLKKQEAEEFMSTLDFPLEAKITTGCKFVRKAMLKIFGNKCYYTGVELDMKTLTVDHIVPKLHPIEPL